VAQFALPRIARHTRERAQTSRLIKSRAEETMESRRDMLKLTGGALAVATAGLQGLGLSPAAAAEIAAQPDLWINKEASRWAWVTARMIDCAFDTKDFVQSVKDMHANVLVMTTGGVVAFYPSEVQYHVPSSYMRPGHDYFGETAAYAKAQGIRMCGRLDFSRVVTQAYKDHPEWFFLRADGKPVVDETGRYQPCINGGWYRGQALKVTAEVVDRYDLSGLFLNNFVNDPRSWGDQGLCHCQSCQTKFQARFGRAVPDKEDNEYRAWINECVSEASALHRTVVKAKRPNCIYLNDTEPTDGAHSETRMPAYPAQLWPYAASSSINQKRTSNPAKAAMNLIVNYSTNAQRLATIPTEHTSHDLYQALANGSAVVVTMTGTTPMEDQSSNNGAKGPFAFAYANRDLYVGQRSAARILVLAGGGARGSRVAPDGFRGVIRILSEAHIPFAISDNVDVLHDPKAYDLVIVPAGTEANLEGYIRQGGKAIFVQTPPEFAVGKPVKVWSKPPSSYFRIHDRTLFPSVGYTNLVALSGDFYEYPDDGHAALTFVPPALSEMAETAQSNMTESTKPGLIMKTHGQGRLAYIPWDMPGVHYRQNFAAPAAMLCDLVDHMLGAPRQLKTNAHPHIEITLLEQPGQRRRQVHLVNATGQAQQGYAPPLPVHDIEIEVAGAWRSATSRSSGKALPVKVVSGRTSVRLPTLNAYDVVVFA
jgi:hypothetical protein